jgi:hypothetical protein
MTMFENGQMGSVILGFTLIGVILGASADIDPTTGGHVGDAAERYFSFDSGYLNRFLR